VGELLKMMDLAREFETSFNLMQNSDENYKRLQSILRVN
jgi:flagellar basal body rod protein FlgF